MTNKRLNLRDIVVISFISAVLGVLYLLWVLLGQLVTGIFGPVGGGLMAGFWILAPVICAYIVQKPGAALLAELIAAGTEVMAGSVSAGSVLVLGFTQGLAAEIIFAVFFYRVFRLPVLMLAGMAGTFAAFLTQYVLYGFSQYAGSVVVFMLVTMLISGALLAGWAGKSFTDALVKTGVLDRFALGRQYRLGQQRDAV